MSAGRSARGGPEDVRRGERGEALRLALSEFLGGAGLWAAAVLALGGFVHLLDRVRPNALEPVHRALGDHLFRDGEATATALQSISATVITVASITFALMLVAIQQSASSLTAQVFDQFMRRRTNQFYFGFFIGLGGYALLQATTAHEAFNPVYGAALTLLLSVVAVMLLVVLLYTAVNQMRPVVIIEAIHDHLVEARLRQLGSIVRRTRREPQLPPGEDGEVVSDRTGFVIRLDLDRIQRAIDAVPEPCEVLLEVSIGTYVAYGDRLARVRGPGDVPPPLEQAVLEGLRLERQRTIDAVDAAYGIEQLETVGWTSTSGAHHNPQAARLVVANLRDLLARFTLEDEVAEHRPDTAIVYRDDVPAVLMRTLESLAVVTADSQQHQVAADIIDAIESMLPRLSPAYRGRAIDVLKRTLPALASHPPTLPLERALERLEETLRRAGDQEEAALVATGLDRLRARIGAVEPEYTPR